MSDRVTPSGRDNVRTAIRLLREALPSRWKIYVLSLFCMVGAAGMTAALAYSTRLIVNDVFVAADASKAIGVAGLVVLVAFLKSAFQYANSVMSVMFNRSVAVAYQKMLFRKVLGKDVWHFGKLAATKQMAQVNTYGRACGTTVVNLSNKLLNDLLTLAALFGVMLMQDPLMTLASCLLFPIIFLLVGSLSKRIRAVAAQEADLLGASFSAGAEAFSGIKTVKSYGLEAKSIGKFDDAVERLENRTLGIARVTAATVPIMEFLGGLVIGLFVIYASWQTLTYGKTPGEFTAFITAFLLAYQPAERVSQIWVDVQKTLTQVNRMYALLAEPPRLLPAGDRTLDGAAPAIRFEKVSFEYVPEAIALHDVSFDIRPGERVAIVGRSGAGKSTLIDLVLRFYDPTSGRVLIGGIPAPEVSEAALRSYMALISQDVFLFEGTIRDNIRDGRPDATDDEVLAAARQAALDDLIDGQPEGLDKDVGPNGSALSGGQRQRIGIARALLRHARIFVFDEATSALDAENEKRIMETLKRDLPDATILFVTHRISTIAYVDRAIMLDAGRLVAIDTAEQLMTASPEFRQLFDIDGEATG